MSARVLEGLKPQKVFYYFEEISNIPRGSGNTKAVSDYCVRFAKDRGLYVRQDELNNVIIKKSASKGRENSPAIVLQGHLDMVAEKTAASDHDFLKDGLKLMVEGDYITAKDTTLGADNGIAIAYSLAVLDDDTITHPSIEAIFTIDEETGMNGAKFIDLSDIEGKYLLNLDCDMEDTLMAGCAGGVRVDGRFPLNCVKKSGNVYEIKVSGLKGGHSGSEIDKERGNANIILGRVLGKVYEQLPISVMEFSGGNKDNAITRTAACKILSESDLEYRLSELLKNIEADLKKEFEASDPDVYINSYKIENVTDAMVWGDSEAENIIAFLNLTPNGVMNMCFGMNGLVETSLNLGITTTEKEYFHTVNTIRSVVASKKELVKEKVIRLIKLLGGNAEFCSDYPQWDFKRDSYLQKKLTEIYKREFDRELKVEIIHAGLECGYLLQKKPELDIVSFGPVMYDIHTTEERLSISSTEMTYKFILKILEEL